MRDANDPLFDQFDDGLGGDGGHGAAPNPLLVVHRRLRGRYLIAIVLGLAFAIPGAIVGWKAIPVRYTGVATIELQPSLRKVLYTTDENELMPFFEEFVQTQSALVRLPQVLSRAADNPKLREAGWPRGPAGAAQLADALEVGPVRGSHTINIEVTHADPRVAQVATNAVLQSYEEHYYERSGRSASERETALQSIVRERSRELTTLREEMFRLSNNLGAETLPRRLQSKADELEQYDQLISQLELALTDATAREQGEGDNDEFGGMTLDELALFDEELAGLLAARRRARPELSSQSPDDARVGASAGSVGVAHRAPENGCGRAGAGAGRPRDSDGVDHGRADPDAPRAAPVEARGDQPGGQFAGHESSSARRHARRDR